MRILIQRVSRASVEVEGSVVGAIGAGLVAFVGIRETDTEHELDWLIEKLLNLRVFADDEGKMNLSLLDRGLELLLVSQFTLYGDARKGNRPNFMAAANPDKAKQLYNILVERLGHRLKGKVSTGVFQATMKVELVNEGPVTILLEKEAADAATLTATSVS